MHLDRDKEARLTSPKIVLCATQRCGSTMVIEDMRNTGKLGNPEEWFVPWDPEKTDIDWNAQLDGVFNRATGETGIVAIKVMANQLAKVDRCLSGQPEPTESFEYFYRIFADAVWVKISRRDVIYQAISRLMARQTGINHATKEQNDEHFAGNLLKGYDPKYNDRTKYKYDAILYEINSITLENLAWTAFFEQYGIKPFNLVYEEFSADPNMIHLDVMAEAIGLSKIDKKQRKMVKVGNSKNKEWHQQFLSDVSAKNFRA
ncbi:MAG: Stf0 family sulfotransferase [Pseudomonadota bacterium]